jgi:protein phosphatase 2C
MSVQFVSLKGKRDQNEDKHNIITNLDGKNIDIAPINFFSIYDGHGGKFVSSWLEKHLPKWFTDQRLSYPLSKDYIHSLYSAINKEFQEKYKKQTSSTGATCLIAIQYKLNNSVYLNILNTGDCRAVMCRDNNEFCLTKDHKPHWPEEKLRIESLGGKIYFDGYDWRVEELSVSRAFGDLDAAPYLTSFPDVFQYKITSDDKFLVLACDGLWDVMSNSDVVNFVLSEAYDLKTNTLINNNINIAKKLAKYAISKGSTDNVSVIIIFF